MEKIIADFDKISQIDEPVDNNSVFHNTILENINNEIDTALDIGCGKGDFTRLLAARSRSVTGIDISRGMIEKAKKLSSDLDNIKFITGNIIDLDIKENSFDVIVSIAAFHHIDMELLLPKLKTALKKNGKMIVLDIYKTKDITDYFLSFISVIYSRWIRLWNKRSVTENRLSIKLWQDHALTDNYLYFSSLCSIYSKYLGNITINRKLLWRYLMIWEKQ